MADNETIEKEFEGLTKKLKGAIETIEKKHGEIIGEMKTHGDATTETKAAADKALTEIHSISSRLTDIEQKLSRRPGGGGEPERKSLGQIVVDNEEVKTKLLSGKKGAVSLSVETKTILSGSASWGSTASVTNSLVIPDRQPMVPLPMRQMTIRDLVAPGQTTSNAIEFPVQVARTNNAAVVAENATKPASNYTWDLRTFPVRTIAHVVKASRQILDDAPGLQSTIDAEMRYGLELTEEGELLNGDGTGAHILGLIPQATAYSGAFLVTGETNIDRLRLAALQGILALFPMTGFVLNPTDWAKIEMTKDGMGRYIVGNPMGQVQPMLWGLPVVSSIGMSAGTFLAGAFKYAAQIFDRMSIEVLISTENNDDFEKNMVTIRAEERLAMVVKRPAALITGTLL